MYSGDTKQRVNAAEYGFQLCAAYLLDWSLTDLDEQVMPIQDSPREDIIAILKNLPLTDYTEILTAIQDHENRVSSNLVKEKNDQSGVLVSSASSPSAA